MFVAEARVVKAGATLTVVRCEVYGQTAGDSKMVAIMLATMIRR
jgi:acyl-coenzyme A thioesterase PaaI-like protein